MEEIKLAVEIRNEIGRRRIKTIRHANLVPAIVYGGDRCPTPIKVNRREYQKIMRHHQGQNVVFHLEVMQDDKKLRDYSAILKEEQLDPARDTLLHIDFCRISLKNEIEVKVYLASRGDAIGVKQDGGSLDQAVWELDIICLPMSIPEKIYIDVSELKIGDAVYVKDIVLPKGVKTKHDPETIVFSVVPSMKEVEVPGSEEEAEPELIKKKAAEQTAEEKSEK